MGWVLMSEREVHRVEVLSSVVARRMSTTEAASVLCLSERQVQRLLRTFREDGAVALRHKARGRPSNNRTLDGLRDLTMAIVRERYSDFGPTLAAEKLAERDGMKISRETLRK
jgi:transposase